MILLCCWRTAKESSLLLADIVSIIETQDTDFSNALITQICLCLTLLLSETKHRGAFEQIYVAYSKVCSIMWKYVFCIVYYVHQVHCTYYLKKKIILQTNY